MKSSKTYLKLVKRAYTTFKVPVSVVDASGKTLFCFPEYEGGILPSSVIKYEIDCFAKAQLSPFVPYMKSTPYNSYIGLMRLPNDDFLFVGPAFTRPFSVSSIANISKEPLNKNELMILQSISHELPLIDSVFFADTLSSLTLVLHFEELSPAQIIAENKQIINAKPKPDVADSVDADFDGLLLFEFQIYSAVESGNRNELSSIWKQPTSFIRKVSDELMYYERHLIIPLLSTARFAALSSGAPKDQVISMFHTYVTKIAMGASLSMHLRIVEQATYDFCDLVRRSKETHFHTNLCIMCEHYIDDHISEKITAQDLAKHCQVDRSLIFDVFKINHGISLNTYIQNERLRRAKVLLLHSRYSISDIAASLGYASSSYFTQVFTKHIGCTPKEFKERNGEVGK